MTAKFLIKFKSTLMLIVVLMLTLATLSGCSKDAKDVNQDNEVKEELTVTEDNNEDDKDTLDNSTDVKNEDVDNNESENKDTDNNDAVMEDVKDKIKINVAALKGPTGMGMVKLMEDAEADRTANDYNFTIAGEADIISTGLIKGEFDIAAIPCNLASVLYNKTEGKIKLAGINTLGVLYIIETGDSINSIEDLKGKTIYSTGYGTTPQYTLNYLLSLYGLDPEKDLTIEYKTEATEVAAILQETDDAIAMLPQPFVTTVMMNNDRVRIALDIEEEWASHNENSGVVTGVVVVNSDFLDQHPQAVEEFLNEYENSAKYVNDNVDSAAELVEKYGLFKAAVAKKAIPFCNITLIRGLEMKEMVENYLKVLYEQNPNAVGGALPTGPFYHIHE